MRLIMLLPKVARRRLQDPGVTGQVLRFALVGGTGFILDAAVLKGLIFLGVNPWASRLISISAAVAFTWIANRALTFATQTPASWGEFAHYVANSLGGMAINYAVYALILKMTAGPMVALAAGTLAGSVFNFVRYRALLAPR